MKESEYLLLVTQRGKSFKPLKEKFTKELEGFYTGIGYAFPQKHQRKLEALLKELPDIRLVKQPLPSVHSFESFRQLYRTDWQREQLYNLDRELDTLSSQYSLDLTEEMLNTSTLSEIQQEDIREKLERKSALEAQIKWSEGMEKTLEQAPVHNQDEGPSFILTIDEWLLHFGANSFDEIPPPAHLFEATPAALNEKKIFFGTTGRLMQRGEPTVIGGAPKSGKSLLALNMAISVATGTPFLNIFNPTIEGPVLFLSFEDDISVLLNRLSYFSFDQTATRKVRDQLFIHNGSAPLVVDTNKKSADITDDGEKIREICLSIKPVFIVVDTLSKAFSYDENCNKTANAMLLKSNELFGVRKGHPDNPSILFVQHVRKATSYQKEEISVESIRGAGAFAAGCRTVLGVELKDGKRILHMLGSNCGEDFKAISLSKEVNMCAALSEVHEKNGPPPRPHFY